MSFAQQLRSNGLIHAQSGTRFGSRGLSVRRDMAPPPDAHAHFVATIGFVAEWARLAFPTIQISHRYAAALMATKPADDDIRCPWPFFLITVPDGLIAADNRGSLDPISYVACMHIDNLWTLLAFGDFVILSQLSRSLDWLRTGKLGLAPPGEFDWPFETRDERALACVTRLVLNTCSAMNDPANVREAGKAHGRWRNKEPIAAADPRIFVLGRPVTVDCRDAVRDYIAGQRGTLPSVRWLVRGHWTHQVCGIGRTQRRLRWIEPHWAGRNNTAVNVRSHVL